MRIQSRIRASHVLTIVALLAVVPCMAGATPPRGTGAEFFYVGDIDPPTVVPPIPMCTVNEAVLHDQLRVVYENELLWTRMVAMGVLHDISGHDAYIGRLKDNYKAFENALVPFYGSAAEKLGALVEEHVVLTAEVFHEVYAGGDFTTVLPRWYQNADQIANYLSSLNPEFWPAKEMEVYWRVYLDDILRGSLAFYENDWNVDVIMLDAFQRDSLAMADYMTTGIVQQCAGPQ